MYTSVHRIRRFAVRGVAATLAASMCVARQAYGAGDGSVDHMVEISDATTNGPTLANNDYFGTSVVSIGDLDGDGVSDLAVGAALDDAGGTDRGAVHILFMNADGSVDSTIEINDTTTNGPTLADGDRFGRSIASIGDLNSDGVSDLAVSAYGDDTGGAYRGGAHILFMNADGSVDATVKIDSATTNGPVISDYDSFGTSIASLGDLDGDGVEDLAVGAVGDDAGGGGRGAVHILFMNADGSVNSKVEVNDNTANGPTLANYDAFGTSVVSIGDLDGDGVSDLAVGVVGDDTGGGGRGGAHILFMNADGSVDSTAKIDDTTTNGPTLADYDAFGASLASLGDLDGDGVSDLAVGAKFDDAGGSNRGTAHLLFMNVDGSVDSTVEVDDLTANGPDLADGDQFAFSAAGIGDLDGDGVVDLAVGARADDAGGTNRGAVHVLFLGAAPDVAAPTVTLDAPANLATVSGAAVALTATASDAVGVAGVQFKLDLTTAIGAEDTGTPFAATWDSTGVADGDHTLSAVARDAAGNYATSTVTVTVSNAAAEDDGDRHSSSGRRGGGGGGGSSSRSGSSDENESSRDGENQADTPDGDADSPYPHSFRQAAQNLVSAAVRDLWQSGNDRGQDVRALQIFLNTSGFTLAATGPGSPGQETDFFGSLTRAALARWQAAHGVVPAVGYYGPITRAAIAAEAAGL